MEDKNSTGKHGASDGFVHFIDWLNEKMMPLFGPPPLGPYETVVGQVGVALCPVCGTPMAEHLIDRSARNAVLHCPAEHLPLPVHDEPLSELGKPRPPR